MALGSRCRNTICRTPRGGCRAAGRCRTQEPARRAELLRISEVCRWVPANPPRSFQEAFQMYWFIHLGVVTELNTWDSFNPGRLDQHLWPFSEAQSVRRLSHPRTGARTAAVLLGEVQ